MRKRIAKTTNETPSSTTSDCEQSPEEEGPHAARAGARRPRCAASAGTCRPAAPTRAVALPHEVADVARERGGIARHVDDARGRQRRRARPAPWDGSPRAAGRRPPRPRATPCRTSSGSTWRTSPARNVQLSMPLARALRTASATAAAASSMPYTRAARRASSRLMAPVPGVEVEHRLRRRRARTPPRRCANSRSACTVFVWKNEFAETWKSTSSSDSVMCRARAAGAPPLPTATLAFLALTFSTTLAVAGTRARSASATGASASTSGADATTFTIASPVSPALAQRDEPQQPALASRGSYTESARVPHLARGSRRAACSSSPTGAGSARCRARRRSARPRAGRARRPVARRHRELHLVAVAVGLGRRAGSAAARRPASPPSRSRQSRTCFSLKASCAG